MIYGHAEPRWNDTDRENKLIRPPELTVNYTSSHLVAKEKEHGEGNAEFYLRSIMLVGLLTCCTSHDMGQTALLPLRRQFC
jgi:hypothetical protein